AASQDSQSPWLRGSEQSPIVKSSDTLNPSYWSEWRRGISSSRPSGMTSPPSGASSSEHQSISSSEDSPARISALRDIERAWTESDRGFSLKSSDSFASADLDSSCWRTHQISLFSGLTEYSWSSMRWGMMRDGLLYQPKK